LRSKIVFLSADVFNLSSTVTQYVETVFQMSSKPNPVLEGYVSRPELAKLLGRDERTIYRWAQLRRGPPLTRLGNTPLYSVEGVRAWLKSREQEMPRAHRRRVAS
jgi:predicted DNA-binding transcriptional regulator AlpA